jgi:membrane-associated protease RseP (regulator of RpoE activity)
VIGWLRPVVLVPASALSGLTPEQLQAVVAHELAHIRRHDYLVNILQTVAETLLYYHPAVWWLSGRIRAEREHAADDIAVAACGDPLLYARALESLERVRPATAMAVGATGGSLVGRVRRILGRSLQAEPAFGARSAWLALPASLAALAVIVFSGSGSPAVATPAPPLPPMPEFELLFNPQGNLPAAPGPAIAVAPELAAPQQIAVQDHVEALPGAAIAVAPARPGAVQLPNFTAQVPSTPATPVQWTALEPGFAWTPAQTPAPFPTVIHRGDGWIGVELGDGPDRGAVVNRVVPDSPASDAGIEPGDLITEYNQTPVVGARQLSRLASETPIGRTVPLAIVRGGQEQTVQVTVAEPSNPFRLVSQRDNYTSIVPGGADGDVRQIFGYNTGPFSVFGGGGVALGVQVDTMTPELRQFFGADPGEGVLIVGMEEDSIGERAGLRVGDVIVAVDGNVVDSANDVRNLTRAVLATGNSVTVTVMRDRNQSEVVVEAEDQE